MSASISRLHLPLREGGRWRANVHSVDALKSIIKDVFDTRRQWLNMMYCYDWFPSVILPNLHFDVLMFLARKEAYLQRQNRLYSPTTYPTAFPSWKWFQWTVLKQKYILKRSKRAKWTLWGLNPGPLACKASDTTTDLSARSSPFLTGWWKCACSNLYPSLQRWASQGTDS